MNLSDMLVFYFVGGDIICMIIKFGSFMLIIVDVNFGKMLFFVNKCLNLMVVGIVIMLMMLIIGFSMFIMGGMFVVSMMDVMVVVVGYFFDIVVLGMVFVIFCLFSGIGMSFGFIVNF